MGLPKEIRYKCSQLLTRLEVFDSQESLATIFHNAIELKSYASQLPYASNRQDRVNRTMAYLIDKYTDEGPVILLFLMELIQQIPEGDRRRQEMAELLYQVSKLFPNQAQILPAKAEVIEDRSKPKLFLSYARLDGAQVEKYYLKLTESGCVPWMDTKDIFGGEIFELATSKAINNTDFFLIFLSSNSVGKRGFIQIEIKLALEQFKKRLLSDIYIIPLLLQSCSIPDELAHIQAIDLSRPDGLSRLINSIQEGMKRLGR